MKYKYIIRPALITIGLLLIPFIGMQVSNQVDWSPFDFILMGILIFGFAGTYELVSRQAKNIAYRAAVGIAVITTFLLIWVNLAVGIIGSEDNPANALYLAIPLVGLAGAFISRLRAGGMTWTMLAMAMAQLLVPAIAAIVWQPTLFEAPGIIGVVTLNAVFAMLFASSGLLFRRAGETEAKQA